MPIIGQTNQLKNSFDRLFSLLFLHMTHLWQGITFKIRIKSFVLPLRPVQDALQRLVHHTKYLTWSNKQLSLRKYCYLTILRTEAKIVSNFFNFELIVHSFDRHSTWCWFQHSFTNKSKLSPLMNLSCKFSIPTRMNVVVVFPAPLCPNNVHTSPS